MRKTDTASFGIAPSIKSIKQCLLALLCAAAVHAGAGNSEVKLSEGPLISGQGNVHPQYAAEPVG
jgi:hypothetical protein